MMAVNGIHGVACRQPPVSSELKTMRDCGTISRKLPGLSLVPPSGPLMKVWKSPPARRSKARSSVVHGFGHHHCFSSSGSVQARHSVARGARTRSEMTRSRVSAPAFRSVMGQALLVKLLGKGGHAVASGFPRGTLLRHPLFGLRQRLGLQLAVAYA